MISDLNGLARRLEQAVREFTDVAVVGISGGVDSATVAAVCTAALGKENVYVVSMPYDQIDVETFNARSAELAESLGAHHLVVPIGEATNALLRQLTQTIKNQVKQDGELHQLVSGNTRARMRMATLYAVAGELSVRLGEAHSSPGASKADAAPVATRRVRVMGTGNASEDLIGYDTKGGDALADLFVIGELFKSEVYQLAAFYKVPQSILKAPPSAGLYPGQTDAEELGYDYDTLEPALRALYQAIDAGVPDEKINRSLPAFKDVGAAEAEFVIKRFLANAHKHRAPQVVKVRGSGYMS